MEKIPIRLISVNGAIRELNLRRLYRWKTKLFRISTLTDYDSIIFHEQYDCDQLQAYSASLLNRCLSASEFDGLTVFITYEPLEDNQFSVLLDKNRVVFSLYEVQDILRDAEIPLENHIISLLYTYSLMLIASKYKGEQLLIETEATFAHDSFRKCLFDYRNDKLSVKYTSITPILCEHCVENLKSVGVSDTVLASVKNELKRLKKDFFYIIVDFLKNYPILSFLLTTLASFLLNLLCNIIV